MFYSSAQLRYYSLKIRIFKKSILKQGRQGASVRLTCVGKMIGRTFVLTGPAVGIGTRAPGTTTGGTGTRAPGTTTGGTGTRAPGTTTGGTGTRAPETATGGTGTRAPETAAGGAYKGTIRNCTKRVFPEHSIDLKCGERIQTDIISVHTSHVSRTHRCRYCGDHRRNLR
jgi:hypothetical protein